jgi:nitrite reductase/ring-hydroxylating ferredoxin subunit
VGEHFVSAIAADEIAPGGIKAVHLDGRDIVVCNSGGRFFAIERRCGHMNAPLEMGTLDGTILTCPMHCAQFDITTGEALAGTVPHDEGTEPPPPKLAHMLANLGALMRHIKTEAVGTYEAKVESGVVWISL